MKKIYVWLCMVILVIVCVGAFISKPKANATADSILTGNVIYNGVVARANPNSDFYLVVIHNANYDMLVYQLADFEGLTPEDGALVYNNLTTDKWVVHQNYTDTFDEGYDTGYYDGYEDGYIVGWEDALNN